MKWGYVVGGKIPFREAGDIRKFANGHCTATKLTRKAAPNVAACFQRVQSAGRCRNRSKIIAGIINRTGKSGGTRCVMCWYTGPSLGSAGTSGNPQTKNKWSAVNIAAMMVAAQRFFATHATVATQIGAVI